MKTITIVTSFDSAEAGLVCARLEAAGFHPFLGNENASAWLGGTMSTATQLQIQVPKHEAVEARAFLDAPAE